MNGLSSSTAHRSPVSEAGERKALTLMLLGAYVANTK